VSRAHRIPKQFCRGFLVSPSDKALLKLRKAFESDKRNPYYISFLGLTIARAEQNWEQALDLCETAVNLKPKEIKFHLNLIEVYALAGWREKALRKVDSASKLFGNDARLKRFRAKVVERRTPVLSFLGRGHFLNRELGKLRHRMVEAPSEIKVLARLRWGILGELPF
jgi:tetratricopeptide (TPR) repeat protein